MNRRNRLARAFLLALALFLAAVQPLAALPEDGSLSPAGPRGGAALPAAVLWESPAAPAEGAVLLEYTRAQYLQLLYEAFGSPEVIVEPLFTDVAGTADYAAAVTWAWERGVVAVTDTRLLNPDEIISRQEAERLLLRALSALGAAARQISNSVLAAHTGRISESAQALMPAAMPAALDDLLSGPRIAVELPSAAAGGPPPDARGPSPSLRPLLL